MYPPPNGTAKSLIAHGAPTLLVNLRFRGNDVKKAEPVPIELIRCERLKCLKRGPKARSVLKVEAKGRTC